MKIKHHKIRNFKRCQHKGSERGTKTAKMTTFNDFLHFFFNILGNKHPNNTNTGIRISQMNFLAHENVETHPPRGGIHWYFHCITLKNCIISFFSFLVCSEFLHNLFHYRFAVSYFPIF